MCQKEGNWIDLRIFVNRWNLSTLDFTWICLRHEYILHVILLSLQEKGDVTYCKLPDITFWKLTDVTITCFTNKALPVSQSCLQYSITATQGQMSLKTVCFSAKSYKQKYQNLSKLFTMYVCVGVFMDARGWGCVCVCTCLQIWLYTPWFGSDCSSNSWPLDHDQNISCLVLTCYATVNCKKECYAVSGNRLVIW